MNVMYQKIQFNEVAELMGLMSALGYSLEEKALTSTVNEIRNRGGEVFVAKVNDLVVGCVCAIIDVRLAAGRCGEIVSLVISEKYRKKGIGKGLVLYAERWLSRRVGKIRVRANIIRSEAHRFYQALGYEETKIQKIFTKKV